MYCDVGVNEDGELHIPVGLVIIDLIDCPDESEHVCHKGYVSLFPFMLSLLPSDSPRLGPILDLLRDPDHLWSPYGIRSLSASHPSFGTGENYWKGPIWLPMNYMVLQSLHNVRPAWKIVTVRANRHTAIELRFCPRSIPRTCKGDL